MNEPRNVAILVFPGIEVLDFAGPFEVFGVTGDMTDPTPFEVYTIAESTEPIRARGGLLIQPNYHLYAAPPPDILLVPGGAGSRPLMRKLAVLRWLRAQAPRVEILCSVCTGALVLAKAGLLAGQTVTTHHDNFDDLRDLVKDTATVVEDQRFTDNGKILTSGGVSAGIDMSLHIVHRLLGDEAVQRTITEMEYPWTPGTKLEPSAPPLTDAPDPEAQLDEASSLTRLLSFWKEL